MSKRSRSVGLLLMAATPIVLTACSKPSQFETPSSSNAQAYASVQSCVNDGRTQSECESALATAQQEREKSAPRFASKDECEKQFDHCGPNQAGGVFMPLLAGYMVGSMINRTDDRNRGAGFMGNSVFRSKNGDINRLSHTADGKASVKSVRTAHAPTASRGGFGGRSYARSMGG